MQLELRHLEAVCRIEEAGSLARAARRLGVSQPALSAQLRRIERVAGGELFTRSAHGVEPTELGVYVLDRARRVLGEMEALSAGARSVAATGTIRLGGVSLVLLHTLLTESEPRLAGQELLVENIDSVTALARQLAAGHFDAILYAEMGDFELPLPEAARVRTLIAEEPLYVGLSTHHRLAAQPWIDLGDLADEEWLGLQCGDDGGPEHFTAACAAAGFVPRFRHRLADWQLNRRMIAEGRAVGLYQATARESDGLVLRPLTGDPLTARIRMAWLRSRLSDTAIDELHTAVIAAYQANLDNNPHIRGWWEGRGG